MKHIKQARTLVANTTDTIGAFTVASVVLSAQRLVELSALERVWKNINKTVGGKKHNPKLYCIEIWDYSIKFGKLLEPFDEFPSEYTWAEYAGAVTDRQIVSPSDVFQDTCLCVTETGIFWNYVETETPEITWKELSWLLYGRKPFERFWFDEDKTSNPHLES